MNCPQCQSSDTRFREKRNDWFCDACDHRWEAPVPAKSESSGGNELRLFVSYGREDATEFIDRLVKDLNDRGHGRIFVDRESIQPGVAFNIRIEEGIRECDVVAAVLSPHALREESVCHGEVVYALNARKQVVPLRFIDDPSVMPGILLCHRNWIDFSADYDLGLESICRLLQGDTGALLNPPLPTITGAKPFDFAPMIAEYYSRFTGREWLREEVSRWLRQPDASRALVLVGARGVGKSAITAWLSQVLAKDVVAVHFCTDRNTSTTNPHQFVASLVAQLHAQLPNYAHQVKELNPAERRETAAEAFRQLIVEPINKIWPDDPKIILVDSLDEAQRRQSGETVAEILERHANDLPDWLRIVATTRPEEPVLKRIKPLDRFDIESQGEDNLRDVKRYLAARLAEPPLADQLGDDLVAVQGQLTRVVVGNFEFARLAVDALEEGSLRADQLDGLTTDLLGFYSHSFKDQFGTVENYDRTCGPLLNALAVARAPLPLPTLKRLSDESPAQVQQRIVELQRFLRVSGTDREPHYELAHQSIRDWLMDRTRSEEFACHKQESCTLLADALWGEWRDNEYALKYLPTHLIEAERWDQLEELLTEFSYLEARNEAALIFDLARDFTHAVNALPKDRPLRRILQLLDKALGREINFIHRNHEDYPQGLFQCLWNLGWWCDCPQAFEHYRKRETRFEGVLRLLSSILCRIHASFWPSDHQASLVALPQHVGPKLHMLLETWWEKRQKARDGSPWLRALRPPAIHLGTAQRAVLRGHENGVLSVSYSPDGARIVSGSGDKTVRVWDAVSGGELAVLRGHEYGVLSVSYSPDGARIVSGSADNTVRVWDAASGAELAVLSGHEGGVTSVSYSPDGARIVSGSTDKTVRVWDAASGAELAVLSGHKENVNCVSYSPDGARIVSGSGSSECKDCTVRVWDAASGAELSILRGHKFRPVNSVSYSPDGTRIVSGSTDETVRVWDAASGAVLAVLRGRVGSFNSVSYSPDGPRIVSGSFEHTVRVWDAAGGAELAVLRGHEACVNSVSYSPNGAQIVSGSGAGITDEDDNTVRVWDAPSGADVAVLRNHGYRVTSVSYSPDGARIVSGSADNTVRVWDAASGAELAVLRGHKDCVNCVSYSLDGARIVSGSRDKTVRVWDAASGAGLAILRGHKDIVTSVSYSPNGTRIVSGGGWRDNTVRVWDVASGAELAVLYGHDFNVRSVSYSPNGTRIVSGGGLNDNTVRVWDAVSGAELAILRGHKENVNCVSYSPDGARIVSGSVDNAARVWDARTFDCLEVISGNGDVAAIAAGPSAFPFRALRRDQETVIEDSSNATVIARYPYAIKHLQTAPSGITWAGGVGNHLHIITLEDGKIEPSAQRPQQT